MGDCIKENKKLLVLEIGQGKWDSGGYIRNVNGLQARHKNFISEYSGGSKKTICLNDISIIALSKTLSIPLVSMEKPVQESGAKKRRIPDICKAENVEHLTFNQFLRAEKYTG